ncbi:MAG: hypothetical protein HETSPECPRED_008410 [Heterodermia speciosa]|uniref:Heterokaryon incompatibility domain-containing protein n=1 Tax=Heterodermia speciosa TaxID=116794 RepID=A0A8H3FXA0_9LECA|nr:MAG: hypothetical protein HETSPECPRED_008410 [Heterodermia speciosa]
MCQFLLNLAPNYKRNYKLHVRLFDHLEIFTSDPNFSTRTVLPRSRFISVLRENKSLIYGYHIETEIVQSGVLVYSMASSPSPQISSVNPVTVDFKFLASLIAHCQGSHALCTQLEDRNSLPYLYLIDCAEEKVVREHPGQDYLALSYVWGSGSQAKSKAALRNTLPEYSFSFSEASPTVQDAVRVVRNLGRKYLWVDKYCINQNEVAEQQMMLRNMDLIYEHAEATIVAMSGENDEAGLPGVSGRARTPQPQFRTTRGCLISSCPPISHLFQTSKWATRGWTYQEARLSRRCLFFTEHQVYIVCPETTRSESVPSSPRSSWTSSLLNSSRLDANLFEIERSLIANGFWRDRYTFSRRTLTYESDVLDAFRGMLNRSGLHTLWGIPIIPLKATMNPHTGFSLGLLWSRRPSWAISTHLKSYDGRARIRRANFPTWSWTSVTGEIFNDGYEEQSSYGAYLKADSRVSIQSDAYIQFQMYLGGKPIFLHEVLQQQQHSNILPEESPSLFVHGDVVHFTRTNELRYSGRALYRLWGCEHLSLELPALLDLDEDPTLGSTQAREKSTIYDALILVDWNDSQKRNKKRLVLMLLDWIQPGLAERRGLLSDYREEYDAEVVNQIPKTRMSFVLQ